MGGHIGIFIYFYIHFYMISHIRNQDKWKVLAIMLFTLYIVMSSLHFVFQVLQCPDGEANDRTSLEMLRSSFLILSPNLLVFAYFTWKIYRYYNK